MSSIQVEIDNNEQNEDKKLKECKKIIQHNALINFKSILSDVSHKKIFHLASQEIMKQIQMNKIFTKWKLMLKKQAQIEVYIETKNKIKLIKYFQNWKIYLKKQKTAIKYYHQKKYQQFWCKCHKLIELRIKTIRIESQRQKTQISQFIEKLRWNRKQQMKNVKIYEERILRKYLKQLKQNRERKKLQKMQWQLAIMYDTKRSVRNAFYKWN